MRPVLGTWHVHQKQRDEYAKKARACTTYGALGMAATAVFTVVAYFFKAEEVTRLAAAFGTAVGFASSQIAIKLSDDYMRAAMHTDPKREFHENLANPLGRGCEGFIPVVCGLTVAWALGTTAATNEYRVEKAQAQLIEEQYARPIDMLEPIGEGKKPAGYFCRGEYEKTVAVDGELRLLRCAGLDMGPKI